MGYRGGRPSEMEGGYGGYGGYYPNDDNPRNSENKRFKPYWFYRVINVYTSVRMKTSKFLS